MILRTLLHLQFSTSDKCESIDNGWINNECAEYMFLRLNVRDRFTRSHLSIGKKHIRNHSKRCKCGARLHL